MDAGKGRELAQVLNAASEQIDLALLDSRSAVQRLGDSLERLSSLLSQDLAGPEAARRIAEVRAEMGGAITGLQFYDRMTQHLTHVRDYLAGTVEQLRSTTGGFEALNQRLAERLLSDTHRIHLGRSFTEEFRKLQQKAAASAEHGGVPRSDIDLF